MRDWFNKAEDLITYADEEETKELWNSCLQIVTFCDRVSIDMLEGPYRNKNTETFSSPEEIDNLVLALLEAKTKVFGGVNEQQCTD